MYVECLPTLIRYVLKCSTYSLYCRYTIMSWKQRNQVLFYSFFSHYSLPIITSLFKHAISNWQPAEESFISTRGSSRDIKTCGIFACLDQAARSFSSHFSGGTGAGPTMKMQVIAFRRDYIAANYPLTVAQFGQLTTTRSPSVGRAATARSRFST